MSTRETLPTGGAPNLHLQEMLHVGSSGVARKNFGNLPGAIQHVGFGEDAVFQVGVARAFNWHYLRSFGCKARAGLVREVVRVGAFQVRRHASEAGVRGAVAEVVSPLLGVPARGSDHITTRLQFSLKSSDAYLSM